MKAWKHWWRWRKVGGIMLVLHILAVMLGEVSAGSKTKGIPPQELKYYRGSPLWCKDGSKAFPRERLNDNFCDCADGTDEPGTSACPQGRFYCKNTGQSPTVLFSSRVNDGICDCCDGSDEYDGRAKCANSCRGAGKASSDKLVKQLGTPKVGVLLSRTHPENIKLVRQQEEGNLSIFHEEKSLRGLVHKLQDIKVVLVLEMLGVTGLFWWQGRAWLQLIRRLVQRRSRVPRSRIAI